jgi:hypothetical protein
MGRTGAAAVWMTLMLAIFWRFRSSEIRASSTFS